MLGFSRVERDFKRVEKEIFRKGNDFGGAGDGLMRL